MSAIMKEVSYLTTLIFKAFEVTLRICISPYQGKLDQLSDILTYRW